MNEPVVTIKFTETELNLLNHMIDAHICDLDEMYKDTGEGEQVSQAKLTLQKSLMKIETWIADEKHKAITDKKASEGSFKEQDEMETSKRICVPCED